MFRDGMRGSMKMKNCRKRKYNRKKRYHIKIRIGLVIAVAAVLIGISGFQRSEAMAAYHAQDPLQPSIASKIMRFHVLANSDSEEDQQLKLEVRDAVGAMMEPRLAGVKDMDETRRIITDSIPDIVREAEQTLQKQGCTDPVSAKITHADFPVKTYGSYTFPAGNYEALQVVIGEGKGHNWWCVLYPNMCFRDSVYEVVDEDAKEELQEVLSVEEYEDIFSSGNYEVHSRLLDYFQ